MDKYIITIFILKVNYFLSFDFIHPLSYIVYKLYTLYSQLYTLYTILSLSDSDKHFDSALAEYTKRLQKNLTIIDLKPSKADNRELAIQKDTDLIIDWLAKNKNKYDQFILLSINGKDKPTEDWVRSFPV